VTITTQPDEQESLNPTWVKTQRQLAQFRKDEERDKASDYIWQLFLEWEKSQEWTSKTFNAMLNAVSRWRNQIIDRKAKIDRLDEKFTKLAKKVEAESVTRKAVSLQKMLAALQETINLHNDWLQQAKRSLSEKAAMSRNLHKLLLEIEAGQIENLAERFQQMQQKE
jgi:hypothetical protein